MDSNGGLSTYQVYCENRDAAWTKGKAYALKNQLEMIGLTIASDYQQLATQIQALERAKVLCESASKEVRQVGGNDEAVQKALQAIDFAVSDINRMVEGSHQTYNRGL